MKKNHLMEFVVKQTGGKIMEMSIDGVQSEVVVGSSIIFPSNFTPIKEQRSFWYSWKKGYNEHQNK